MMAVDTMMVGHAGGQELAFFSIGLAPQMALLVTGIGLLVGTVVLVAQADGAGKPELAGRIWRLALLIAAVLGTLFGLILLAGEPILLVLGQTPEIRSEEHTSELQSLMRISYAVFCLKKKKTP